MKLADRVEFFSRLRELNPQPKTELVYASPFELLIAVMLSAQATDRSVNLATRRLFALANTPAALLTLGEAALKAEISRIGLYHTKARHILQTCQLLVDQHDGVVPAQREALEALPGVGRKTANVVLNTAFGWPVLAVDTHIFRLANRTGLAPGKTPLMVEKALMKAVPPAFLHDAHHWLILHGRYVCKARAPACGQCVLRSLCGYRQKSPDPKR